MSSGTKFHVSRVKHMSNEHAYDVVFYSRDVALICGDTDEVNVSGVSKYHVSCVKQLDSESVCRSVQLSRGYGLALAVSSSVFVSQLTVLEDIWDPSCL